MDARKASRILFRIVYNSLYSIFFVILLILLAATPGDQIYQTISNHKIGNIPVVGGVCFVTAIVAFFVYASRLYTTRTALATIPKPYLAIEEGEIGKNVRKMIVRNRQRSALIAWESRPRDLSFEKVEVNGNDDAQPSSQALGRVSTKRKIRQKDGILDIDHADPPWGDIAHPGWSSPASPDFPDLHFGTVLGELPNLIEAKVVSLAPPDPAFDFLSLGEGGMHAPPDPQVVALLQRQRHMGLREYIRYLDDLQLIRPSSLGMDLVTRYEYARFSTEALSEHQFRELMAVFSDVLEGMDSLDADTLDAISQQTSSPPSTSAASLSSVVRTQPGDERRPSTTSSLRSSSSVIHYNAVDSPG